jgi:carbon monoxide dehydrogenase subunit G
MQISTGFEIDAPFEEVWAALLDLGRVAPCVPGAEIEERIDDSHARGLFRVRLGPVSASYRGTIAIESADRESGDVVLRGDARDTSGGGNATMVIRNHLAGENGRTAVQMDTEVTLTGRAAQIGGRRSILQSVADRMVGDFASALQRELAGGARTAEPPAPAPLEAAPLVRGVAADHARVVAASLAALGLALVAVVARRRRTRR